MAGIRLGEHAARDVLLVRAIESEDAAATVLTRDDRQYSTSVALKSTRLGETADRRQTAEFLAQRAYLALERLVARYPTLQHAGNLTRWPKFLNWALPLGALVIGLATNAIEGDRLNILAFPLLGMLAWNLAIYVWLLFNWVRRLFGGVKRSAAPAIINWMLRPASAHLAGHPTLERSVMRFGRDWVAVATPLTRSRFTRTLHLSAATFALGIVAGMFARARYATEYTAGWAGTWAGAEAEIAALLKVILGPASALTGISLPTVERLRELRGTGENAGDWLILWMVTAAVFVIVPRLLLALGSLLRSAHLKHRLEIPHDFYVRRVLRDAIGRPRTVRIVPYSFDLAAQSRNRLNRLLLDALGEKTTIEIEPSIAYGEEDEWVEAQAGKLVASDLLIVLFNLSSTPEAENHGELVDRLRQQLNGEAELMVLVDDSSFMHKLRGQASAPRRLDERLLAWRTVLAPCEIDPICVSLDSTDEVGAARELEQAFLRSTSAK
ncbi:MAG: DUF2868 domain-containing protein [Acidobacteria bacterium]|nr:DUF2868 domain-containing protein [Acidobacteriota bacterium]